MDLSLPLRRSLHYFLHSLLPLILFLIWVLRRWKLNLLCYVIFYHGSTYYLTGFQDCTYMSKIDPVASALFPKLNFFSTSFSSLDCTCICTLTCARRIK